MGTYKLKQKWTRHPNKPVPIDWSDPLTEGLLHLYIALPTGVFDLVTNRFISDPTDNVTNEPTVDGLMRNADTTSSGLDFDVIESIDRRFATLGCVGKLDAFASGAAFIALGASDNTTTITMLTVDAAVDGTVNSFFRSDSGGLVQEPSVGTVALDETFVCSMMNSDTRGRIKLNHEPITSSGTKGTDSATTDRLALAGLRRTSSSAQTDCKISLVWLYDRELLDPELTELHRNPWQLLQPRAQYLPLVDATAGVQVALTGVSSTAAVGSVSAGAAVGATLTGVASTVGEGSLAVQRTQVLSGEAVQGDISSPSIAVTVSLSGVGGSSAVGSIDKTTVVALTGLTGTSAVGSVSGASAGTAGLTSVLGTADVGTLGVSKSGTVALTGLGGTADVGTLVGSVPGTGSTTYRLVVSNQIVTTLADTLLPLDLAVDDSGGVTGLSVLVSLRDPADSTSYLDFSDGTFKTSGWAAKTAGLTEIGGGFYGTTLDVSSITNFPTANHAIIEYAIAGTVTAVSSSLLTIAQTWEDAKALTVGKFLALK